MDTITINRNEFEQFILRIITSQYMIGTSNESHGKLLNAGLCYGQAIAAIKIGEQYELGNSETFNEVAKPVKHALGVK